MEQAGGRVYHLKSLGYENQQTRSVVCLVSTERSAAVRCGTVRLCSLILAFPPPKVSRNKGAEPNYISTLRWVTKPSETRMAPGFQLWMGQTICGWSLN